VRQQAFGGLSHVLVGYMRVSTADERQSVDLQRDALLLAGVDDRHLHQDRASGARDDRLGLKACLADLRFGDVLLVWKLDRLGRSLSHLIRIITDLKERGIGFRSLTEQMDTTTPQGVLMFNLFGSLAEYERALIAERVKAGLAAARRRGRKGGRRPSVDAERVDQIVAALEAGASKASVCRTWVRRPISAKTYGKKREHGRDPAGFGRKGPMPFRRRSELPVCCVQSWRAIRVELSR